MSEVKLERKESVSHSEAAEWLSLLSRAFTQGGHVDVPFGPGTVSLHIPDRVRAEFEVEVEGDEVEIEVEFKWSTSRPEAESSEADGSARQASTRPASTRPASGKSKPARTAKSKRR
jgi:amphi-Trp domain-containing protein